VSFLQLPVAAAKDLERPRKSYGNHEGRPQRVPVPSRKGSCRQEPRRASTDFCTEGEDVPDRGSVGNVLFAELTPEPSGGEPKAPRTRAPRKPNQEYTEGRNFGGRAGDHPRSPTPISLSDRERVPRGKGETEPYGSEKHVKPGAVRQGERPWGIPRPRSYEYLQVLTSTCRYSEREVALP